MNYTKLSKPKSIIVGISKGRPLESGIALLRSKGLKVNTSFKTDREYTIHDEEFDGIIVKYLIINSRDFANYLLNNYIDLAVGFDDTLYHLEKKDYNLKAIIETEPSDSRICLIGREDSQIDNPNNKIFTEYNDACNFRSIFKNLKVTGKFINSHGTSESAIKNKIGDFSIAIVQTGKTLQDNGLKIFQELRNLVLGIWTNTKNPNGFYFYDMWAPAKKYLYIDGVDGSGKDTILDLMSTDHEFRHYVLVNRSMLTELTMRHYDDFPTELGIGPNDRIITLTASLEVLNARIEKRELETGLKRDSWETLESLNYYKFKYKELCLKYGIPFVDTSDYIPTKVVEIIKHVLQNYNLYKLDEDYVKDIFDTLPLVKKGCSKEIRSLNSHFDIMRLIPSIYSHKKKREGLIEGSDKLRMKLSRNILYILAKNCINHTWVYVGEEFIIVEKLVSEPTPIEVVIKSRYEGTDKYRYVGLDSHIDRKTGKLIVGEFNVYQEPYVRFDWRNTNEHPEGDVCLSEHLADKLINVEKSRELALKTFLTLQKFYKQVDIELWDMCLFVTKEGDKIFSEISQDNARYKYTPTHESLDKDSWRSGNSADDVLVKWTKLYELVDSFVKKNHELL